MKYFMLFLAILVTLLVGASFLLFTQYGNNILKPYLQKYLKNEYKREIQVEALTIKTNFLDFEAVVDNKTKIILNGSFDILKKDFKIDYTIKGKNITTPYLKINEPLNLLGKIAGNYEDYQVIGSGKIFRSNINYVLDMQEDVVKNVKVKAKNLKIEDLLSILKKPIYSKGLIDLNIDAKKRDDLSYKGSANVTVHYGILNNPLIQKELNLKISKSITYKGSIDAKIDGDEVLSSTKIVSNVGRMDLSNSKYNFKKDFFSTDYNLLISDLGIFDKILNKTLNGQIKLSGQIQKDKEDLSLALFSNFLDANIEAYFLNDNLKANLSNLNLMKLSNLFGEEKFSDGDLSLKIDLLGLSEKNLDGTIIAEITNGKLLEKEKSTKDDNEALFYNLYSKLNIKDNRAKVVSNLYGDFGSLKLFDSVLNLDDFSIDGKYLLEIVDLRKLKALTNRALVGNLKANGSYNYRDKLSFNGVSDFLDANSTFSFKNSKFNLKCEDLSILKLTTMLDYPGVFDSYSTLLLEYDVQTKIGDIKMNAINGRILKNELTELIFLASKFDLTKEIYKDTLLSANIDNKKVNFTLLMNGLDSYLKMPNGFFDLNKLYIDSDFEVLIKKKDFKGNIKGSLQNPKVFLNNSAYIKREIDKVIEKKVPKEWQNTAKDLLKLFGLE